MDHPSEDAVDADVGALIRAHAAGPGDFETATGNIVARLGRGMTVAELETFRKLRERPDRPVTFRVRDLLLEVLATWRSNGTFAISDVRFRTDSGETVGLRGIVAVLKALGWKSRELDGRRRLFPPGTRNGGPCQRPQWNLEFGLWVEALRPFAPRRNSDTQLVADCPLCGSAGSLAVTDRTAQGMGIALECGPCIAGLARPGRVHWRRKLRGILFAPL